MTSRACFATAFYHTDGYAPNLGRLRNINKFENYYKCMVVMFASVRKQYPEARLILFTNRNIPASYREKLDSLKVERMVIPDEHARYVSDPFINNSFPGCLFTLDVIEHAAASGLAGEIESIFLLDSDCLALSNLDKVIEQLASNDGIFGINLNYELSQDVNGQSRASLARIVNRLAGSSASTRVDAIDYYGGEFYGFSAQMLPVISSASARYWERIKAGSADWGGTFTEEHILSLILSQMRDLVHVEPGLIKRTWTADNFQNIDGSEDQYALLHLPAEKRNLFQSLYKAFEKDPVAFLKMPDEELMRLVRVRLQAVMAPSIAHHMLSKTKGIVKKIVLSNT